MAIWTVPPWEKPSAEPLSAEDPFGLPEFPRTALRDPAYVSRSCPLPQLQWSLRDEPSLIIDDIERMLDEDPEQLGRIISDIDKAGWTQ